MRRSILLAAFALAACGKAEEPKNVASPDVASNFAQPFDAVGTDPSWGLKIRGMQLTLSRPDQPDIVANAPGAVIQPGQAAWTAAMPDGGSLKVSVYASACSDAGGVSYLYSAEVVLPAQSPLVGCAGPPASAASKHP